MTKKFRVKITEGLSSIHLLLESVTTSNREFCTEFEKCYNERNFEKYKPYNNYYPFIIT